MVGASELTVRTELNTNRYASIFGLKYVTCRRFEQTGEMSLMGIVLIVFTLICYLILCSIYV